MIEINTSRIGRIGLIEIIGHIDSISARELQAVLMRGTERHGAEIVLNMAGVNYMSAAGLRVLRELFEKTGVLHIALPSQRTREVMQITGLDAVYKLYGTQVEAIRAIAPVTNAHTHLELGWLAEDRPGVSGMELVDWILDVVDKRWAELGDSRQTVFKRAVKSGIQELIAAGTTTVGDISPTGVSIAPLLAAGLQGVVYIELLGRDPVLSDNNFRRVRDIIERWRPEMSGGLEIGLSIHSPYSVLPDMWQKGLDYARAENLPLCIHMAESRAEYDYMMYGKGIFAERYFPELGAPPVTPPKMTPVAYLEQLGALALKPLLVHAIEVTDEDVKRIKDSGSSVVHCPRSNLRLRCGRMPLEKYIAAGIPVYLGTDSLGSSPSLNVFDELETAVALHHDSVEAGMIENFIHQNLYEKPSNQS